MLILAYLAIIFCVLLIGVFCAVQAFLMLTDAAIYSRDRLASAVGGGAMILGALTSIGVMLWMLNHSPL